MLGELESKPDSIPQISGALGSHWAHNLPRLFFIRLVHLSQLKVDPGCIAEGDDPKSIVVG